MWSGEAQVHVSIVAWSKGAAPGEKSLSFQRGDSADSAWETYQLAVINSSLSRDSDVSTAVELSANQHPKRVFTGQNPQNVGFMLTPDDADDILSQSPQHRDVIFPYMIGDDLLGAGGPTRWIIDFGQRDIFEAMSFAAAYERVKELVMPDVLARAEREKFETGKESTRWTRMAKRWWQFREPMPGTMAAIASVPRYIACARVTRRPIFEFVSFEIHPDGKLIVFAFADDYSFGIIQSGIHAAWFLARCTTLKADFNYNVRSVFDTFPWPQNPSSKLITLVAEAAVALRALRRETMRKLNYSLRDLYRTLEQPGDNPLRDAHARLDSAVRAAYGMPEDADPLAFLLELNRACAAKEKAGEKVTPPGLPRDGAAGFVTEDCISLDVSALSSR